MTNVLGAYYDPWHWRGEDAEFMGACDSAWTLIHQPSARAIHVVREVLPNTNVLLRSWDIDDSNGDRKREMYADPKGAAHKHLDMWAAKRDELKAELQRNGWVYDESKWFMQLINEPDPAYVPQVVEYSLEAMRIAQERGWHLGVVVSSEGNFSKPSENDHGWTLCKPLEKPINDGGHVLVIHEYWEPKGPNFGEDGGNHAWRHHIIPLDVPIIVGEAGANGYIQNRYSSTDDSGWGKHLSAAQYAAQVKEYIEGCDTRVKGVLLFLLDYHNDQWKSFDIHDAADELMAIKDVKPQVPSPFVSKSPQVTTHLPAINNGAPSAPIYPPFDPARDENWLSPAKQGTVAAIVLNGRSGPGLDYPVVRQLMQGEQIAADVAVERTGYTWVRVGNDVWAANDWISWDGEQVPSLPVDNWARAWPIVLSLEGDLSLDPNDPGNYYQGQLVGTKYGISAATWGGQYDIPSLTKEQALAIYQEHYWRASGADALAWPMCLIHFDTAVQFGVNVANQLLHYQPTPEERYLGQRALRYMDDPNWRKYGEAWGVRVDRLQDIAKESN